MFLSFNGGKDCTVLLHLVNRVLQERTFTSDQKLLCIYFQPEQPFPEIERLVFRIERDYKIVKLKTIPPGTSKQQALQKLCTDNEKLKACFMGSRSTDPHCEKLSTFEVNEIFRDQFNYSMVKI